MQLHPTRNAVDLTLAGLVLIGVGFIMNQVAVVAWGGAVLVGLQIARAVTLLSVAQVRAAGFEMLWREAERSTRVSVGETVTLSAEVRNRDSRAARYVELRTLHSPYLDVELEPKSGEVPAGGRLAVAVRVKSTRVGRHGIFGLSLEVQGSPGLYEVPLTFSNPHGLEVLPGAYSSMTRSARGGRSRQRSDQGRAGKRRGGNHELREIREYASGDPFKRIAWRASARRGRLMVKDYDIEEKDVVWVVLDASVELWAGVPGQSPLDQAIERAAWLFEHHATQGDRVGLAILGARRFAWLLPQTGPAHVAKAMAALAFATGTYAADRSAWDESEVAMRVLEHLRPLEPRLADNLRPSELDRIARRVAPALKRAPFTCPEPWATSPRDQALRHYLMSFGIDSPARLEPDRPKTDFQLAVGLKDITTLRPRASLVYVCSPAPDPRQQEQLLKELVPLARSQSEIRWVPTRLEDGLEPYPNAVAHAVQYAVELRAETARHGGERELRKAGVRIAELRPRRKREWKHSEPSPSQSASSA